MADININCGITENLEPVVNMYVKEQADSTGYVLSFEAKGATGIAVDLIRQAAKAEIATVLFKRLYETNKFNKEELDALLEGLGD